MENIEFKNVCIKNRTCYYFNDVTKSEDFGLDNISIYEKSHETILIYEISYKTLISPKSFRIRFDKIEEFIRTYDGTTMMNIIFWHFLVLYQIFSSPQVKRSAIISNKHGIYELPHE